MIATFVDSDHKNWDRNLHVFRHAMDTATQATMKSLRREVEAREEVVHIDPAEWQDQLKRLDALRDLVANHIDIEQERKKKYYDKGRRHVEIPHRRYAALEATLIIERHTRFLCQA